MTGTPQQEARERPQLALTHACAGVGDITTGQGGVELVDADRYPMLVADALGEADVVGVAMREDDRAHVLDRAAHRGELVDEVAVIRGHSGIDDGHLAGFLDEVAADEVLAETVHGGGDTHGRSPSRGSPLAVARKRSPSIATGGLRPGGGGCVMEPPPVRLGDPDRHRTSMNTTTDPREPIIRTEDVVKRFGKETLALDGVSIAIAPGSIYGLLGPNGAGKTTLIRVLATLLEPDSGDAWVAGVNVLEDPVTARTKIGLAGQSAAIDGFLTGRENVIMIGQLYGLSTSEAKVRAGDVLKRIELTEAADRQVKTYSGGMRRRLDLAASLVGRPEVMFLDEPTTGIDPRSRIDIWDIIRDLQSDGTTLLMTTQYLEEVDYLADRIGVIDHGKLIAEGTANELKAEMGGTVIEVVVPDEQREHALQVLQRVTSEEPMFEPNKRCLVVHAPNGSRTLLEVVRALDDAGVVPEDLEMHKPTLDEVFLTLTGHVAEESGDEPAAERPKEAGRSRFGRRSR